MLERILEKAGLFSKPKEKSYGEKLEERLRLEAFEEYRASLLDAAQPIVKLMQSWEKQGITDHEGRGVSIYKPEIVDNRKVIMGAGFIGDPKDLNRPGLIAYLRFIPSGLHPFKNANDLVQISLSMGNKEIDPKLWAGVPDYSVEQSGFLGLFHEHRVFWQADSLEPAAQVLADFFKLQFAELPSLRV